MSDNDNENGQNQRSKNSRCCSSIEREKEASED
jgi:hypothetical protein